MEIISAGLQNRILRVEKNNFMNTFFWKEITIPGFWAGDIGTFGRSMDLKTGF